MPNLIELTNHSAEAVKLRDPKIDWAQEKVAQNKYSQTCFCNSCAPLWACWIVKGRNICGEDEAYFKRTVESKIIIARGYNRTAYPDFISTAKKIANLAGLEYKFSR